MASAWSLIDIATIQAKEDEEVPSPDDYKIEKKFEMVTISLSLSLMLITIVHV